MRRPAWSSSHRAPDETTEGASARTLTCYLTHTARFLGLAAALVGAGHLAAWLGGSMSQRGLSAITMKANAALCLTLVGAALILLIPAEAGRLRRWPAQVLAAAALLIGLLTLAENISGWNFGIDQFLAAETPGAIAAASPNRMGVPASLGFTLIGLALLNFRRRDRRGVRALQVLALAVCLIALLPIIGFLYGAHPFYGITKYTGIAWPTAVALLLLGLGLLCARPAEGLMAQVTANDPGGVSLRRLLPPFVLLPLLLGWLRLAGERAGAFDAPTGTAMIMLLFIVIFSALAYHAGRRVSRAAQALRELNTTLEARVVQRTAELARRAQQLQKLTLELTQAEERERRRIAVILHEDLQQQIAGAKFHLNVVRSQAQDDRQRAYVDKIDTLLAETIEQSRSLSYDLSPAVVHMSDLAEVLAWLAHRVREQHGLVVHLEVSSDMVLHSEALALFLFRAVQEMLFNVVQHAHIREAALRVRRIGRHVCLSVSDRGRGFNPQELKETAGFGLFSIRERTELLGGRMKVQSAKGQGSTLRLVVPDGPEPEDRRQKTQGGRQEGEDGLPSSALRPPSSDHVLRVLLVDDHDTVREGLAALLQEAPGIELVGVAPDGREAIDMALDLHPDVVIMDVSMPLMSGDQATRQIKTQLPTARVIGLSMYDEADKRERMFEAGAEGYILKTVPAEELLAAIRGPGPNEN